MAVSLAELMERPPRRAELAEALLRALDRLRRDFPEKRAEYLEQYRKDCVTIGREVALVKGEERRSAHAETIDEDFQLVVRRPDGGRETVYAGEVSVRGMLGYA